MQEYVSAVQLSASLFYREVRKEILPMTPIFVKTGKTFPQPIPLTAAHRSYNFRGDRSTKVVMNLNTSIPATCTTAMELMVNPWRRK